MKHVYNSKMPEKSHKHNFLLSGVFMLFSTAGDIASALILKAIVDTSVSRSLDQLWRLLPLALLLIVVNYLTRIAGRYFGMTYAIEGIRGLKDRYFAHLMEKLDHQEDIKQELSAFSVDADLLFNSYFFNQIFLMASIISFLLSLVAVIYLNWLLFIVAFATSLLPLLVPYLYKGKLAMLGKRYSEEGKAYLDFVNESLLGREEVLAYSRQAPFRRMHSERNSRLENSRKRSRLAVFNSSRLSYSLTDFSFLAIITLSTILTIQGQVTLGTMMAVIQLIHNIVIPLGDIATALNELNSAKVIKAKYENLPEIPEYESETIRFEHAIQITGLTYAYPESTQDAVFGLDMYLPKNSKAAIIGKTGSGKSTLLKLIMGQITDYSGSITVDGQDIRQIDPKLRRQLFRVVPQDPYLFTDSILNNICFYAEECPKERLPAVLRHSLLEELLLGEGGIERRISDKSRVSGGEKQRIVLARALMAGVKDRILVLDEPSANLDHKSAAKIIENITSMESLTVIMVTHEYDPAVLTLFDQVINLIPQGTGHRE